MAKNPTEIILQCTSESPKFASSSSGDFSGEAAFTRIVLKFDDGSTEVIFTGPKFSEVDYEKRIMERKTH